MRQAASSLFALSRGVPVVRHVRWSLLTGIGFALEAHGRGQLSSLSEDFVCGENQNVVPATDDLVSQYVSKGRDSPEVGSS